MDRITVSSKYQIVIPKEVRRKLRVRPGEKFSVFIKGDTISLVCDRPIEAYRGLLRGVDARGVREKKDRL